MFIVAVIKLPSKKIAAAGTAARGGCFGFDEEDAMSEMMEMVEKLISSLEEEPGYWEFSEFEAVHMSSGVSVWLANSWYGLAVRCPDRDKLGGVTLWSTLCGRFISWRRRLGSVFFAEQKKRNVAPTTARAVIDMLS